MQFIEKFAYIALGGILVIIGQLLPNITTPRATALDKEIVEFDTVACRTLRVVDRSGQTLALIESDSNGGAISVWSSDSNPKASMTVDKNGGLIRVYDNDGKRRAVIDVDSKNNGVIGVLSSDEKPMATIRESEGGGRVLTWSSSGDIVISLP